jgi:hypothetical protein
MFQIGGLFGTRYSGGIPVGEELANLLLLACCYQEGRAAQSDRAAVVTAMVAGSR